MSKGYSPSLFPISIINRHPSRRYRLSVAKSTPLDREGVPLVSLSLEKYHFGITDCTNSNAFKHRPTFLFKISRQDHKFPYHFIPFLAAILSSVVFSKI